LFWGCDGGIRTAADEVERPGDSAAGNGRLDKADGKGRHEDGSRDHVGSLQSKFQKFQLHPNHRRQVRNMDKATQSQSKLLNRMVVDNGTPNLNIPIEVFTVCAVNRFAAELTTRTH
jgi:hypothetical protein